MTKLKLLILAIVAATSLLPIGTRTAQAQSIHVELGDRPYYSRGPYYVEHGYRWVWVPGHYSEYRHHWVHGHYVRRERVHHDIRVY